MSRKEAELSIQEQKELLVCYDNGNLKYISDHRSAKILKISLKKLRMLLKNRKAIESHQDIILQKIDSCCICKKKNGHKLLKYTYVDKGLFQCYQQSPNFNLPVNNDIFLNKTKDLAAQDLRNLLNYALSNYNINDIYSLVETGLYYLDDSNKHLDIGSPSNGCEKYIHRLSILFMCNITGIDKKQPLVIHNNINTFHDVNKFPEDYHTNINPLMTRYYAMSMLNWDREIGSRKILLVLDNRSIHPTLQLENIEIKYLPKHFIHPLGQNILHIAKIYEQFRNTIPPPIVDTANMSTNKTSMDNTTLEYVNMFHEVWNKISMVLIQNCFQTIGFIKTVVENKTKVLNVDNFNSKTRKRYRSTTSNNCFEVDKRQKQSEDIQKIPLDLTKKTKNDEADIELQNKIKHYGNNIPTPASKRYQYRQNK